MAMARAKKQKAKALEESGENLARRIWLAGLGAYGKGMEEAQDQLDKASHEASKRFDELVSKGQRIEEQTRDHLAEAREKLSREAFRERISEARERLTEARDRITEAAGQNTRPVEELIGKVREKMGLDESVHAKLDALSRQVAELTEAVAAISGKRTKPKSKPKAARRGRPPTRR